MTVASQMLVSNVDLLSLPVNISSTLNFCLSVHQAAQSTQAALHNHCRGMLGLSDGVHILHCTAACGLFQHLLNCPMALDPRVFDCVQGVQNIIHNRLLEFLHHRL